MNTNGILLEETMTATLEALEGLKDRVCPIVDIQKSTGPLVVYDQRIEREEQTLTGDSGLQTADFQLHVMHGTYKKMRLLSESVKHALKQLQGKTNGPLLIEAVNVELATPDLMEKAVQLFRRTYDVTFYYQIKEE